METCYYYCETLHLILNVRCLLWPIMLIIAAWRRYWCMSVYIHLPLFRQASQNIGKSSLWKSWHWLQKVVGIPWWKSIPLIGCILYIYINKIFILILTSWWNHSYLWWNLVNMREWRDCKPISVLIGTVSLISPQLQSGKLIKYSVAIIQCWKHATILRI